MSRSKNSRRGSRRGAHHPGQELWGKPSHLVTSAMNGATPSGPTKTLERRIVRKREKRVVDLEITRELEAR